MKALLQDSKQQLAKPLRDARRKLLIILNILYIILVVFFLTSEKITTGNFVPSTSLYFVYLPAILLNLISAIYNIKIYRYVNKPKTTERNSWEKYIYRHQKRLDSLFGWISILPIMAMSFCNLIGLGNPSNDAILTDFALAQTLIIGAVIIVGRKGAVVWFLVVVAVLFWDVSKLGWDYEYHYSTPSEVVKYKDGLKKGETWALHRKAELERNHLNPPKVTRYFNTWIVFILTAFMAAYYFSGITIDIFKLIPSVISNIEVAIEDSHRKDIEINRKDLEIEQREKEITKSAMRIVRYNEILEDVNKEIEKLEFQDRKKLVGIINRIRKALDKEADWENFEIKFDTIHSDFFKIIHEKYPNLSQSEMKHLAYIRLNLSSAEISRLMDIKIESLRSLRYRLKKKLNLKEDIDLRDFTCNIKLIEQ